MIPWLRCLVIHVCLVSLLLVPPASHAQFGATLVFDPSVFGQTVQMLIRQGQQLANEAEMLRQQYQTLVYQARSVASLPLNLWNDIQRVWTMYTDVLQRARGISFALQSAVQQFDALYQTAQQPPEVMARMTAMLQQVRDAGHTAMASSAIYDRLCEQAMRLGQAMNTSGAAVGETSAIQAQTQVLGLMSEQQASLQQILAAQARAQASWYAMQSTAAEQARQDAARWMQGVGTSPVNPPGQTDGWLPPRLSY